MKPVLFLLAGLCLALASPMSAPGASDAETEAESSTRGTTFRLGGSFTTSFGAMFARPGEPRSVIPEEGFVGEFSLLFRIAPPVEGLSVKVRTCFGCHGIELESAYVEYRPWRHLRVRAGRFNLPLGGFNQRHDANIRKTISKPLTRIMGNMVRQREFNSGILPAPAVDTGISIGGKYEFSESGFSLGYDAFAVTGLQGAGTDINFVASRTVTDNNGEPAVGGRIELDSTYWTFGGSYMWGRQDTGRRRSYQIASVDSRLMLGRLTIEGEGSARETQYINSKGRRDRFLKYGYFIQVDLDLWEQFFLVLAADSLFVTDIFLGPSGPVQIRGPDTTDDHNRLFRVTGGINYSPWGGIRLKLMAEYWEFSDFDDSWVAQISVGWAF